MTEHHRVADPAVSTTRHQGADRHAGAQPEGSVSWDRSGYLRLVGILAGRGRLTGGYYHQRKRIEPSSQVADEQNGFELWEVSADLTGLPVDTERR